MYNSEGNPQAQPEELSWGKKILVKGWKGLLKLNGQDAPLTGQSMGKKMLWGIGGGILANFSGMGIIGCLVSALAGMIFNNNITRLGGTFSDTLQGKVKLTDKSVWGPLLGGAAGFGISAFGFNGGFLSSLIVSILGASATDHFINSSQSSGNKTDGQSTIPEEKLNPSSSEEVHETKKLNKERISQRQGDTIDLDKRQIPQYHQTKKMSGQELLSIVKSAPEGVAAVKDKFQDLREYNEFIVRNGLKEVTDSQRMNSFEGIHTHTEKDRSLMTHHGEVMVKPGETAENQHIKMGLG